MTEAEAIEIALNALRKRRSKVVEESAHAYFRERKMPLGVNRSGWVISVRMAGWESFDPSMVFVYVYDPGDEVVIPMVM